MGIAFNLPFKQIKRGVESYKGTKRRFEIICERKKHMIVHDYAHHPDEIRATIKLCRQLRHGKLIVIFQPHTFSRTQALYDDFLKCFEGADEVWLLPIYPAREKPIKGISSYRLAQDLKKSKKRNAGCSSCPYSCGCLKYNELNNKNKIKNDKPKKT